MCSKLRLGARTMFCTVSCALLLRELKTSPGHGSSHAVSCTFKGKKSRNERFENNHVFARVGP